MKVQDWTQTILLAARQMPQYEQLLCKMDTQIGDGDHGVTIARGFDAARQLEEGAQEDAAAFCRKLGDTLSANMGGAIGPIYGLLWNGFAKAVEGRADIDGQAMAAGLENGLSKIMRICQVKAGDKTVVDAMLPAAEAMRENAGQPLSALMHAAVTAAQKGCEATRDMQAKKGRAKFLFEKSIGHVDCGAYSFALWLNEWEKTLSQKEKC